jgi:hypothetical protein
VVTVAQDLLLLEFDPPPAVEAALLDPRVARTGPAVLLFADSLDLDRWSESGAEPHRAAFREVALGYHTRADGESAMAFLAPFLWLDTPRSDPAGPMARISLTPFHPACSGYDRPTADRAISAAATTYDGLPIAQLSMTLEVPQPTPPEGLFLWVNRRRWPDRTTGGYLDAGLDMARAEDLATTDIWRGHGHATLGTGADAMASVSGTAWYLACRYRLALGEIRELLV